MKVKPSSYSVEEIKAKAFDVGYGLGIEGLEDLEDVCNKIKGALKKNG